MRKMPESVAKMYVADQIRLTRGDYDWRRINR
jgi:hypothetical protein